MTNPKKICVKRERSFCQKILGLSSHANQKREQMDLFTEAINSEQLQYISLLQLGVNITTNFSLEASRNMGALTELFALLVLGLFHTSCGTFFKSKVLDGGHFKAKSFPSYTWTGTNVRFPTDEIRHDFVDNKKFLMQNSIQTRFQVMIFFSINLA